MSSAILYVAIVAIWACVLIPRWLRRDSSASASAAPAVPSEVQEETVAEAVPEPAPPPTPRRRRSDLPPERRPAPDKDRAAPADLAHRRVRSARRRLLLMLVGLSIASGVLAGAKMAAWWVIVPPSVMLLCYLPLLRAAAKADAERRAMARYRTARAAGQAGRTPVRRPAPAAETRIISIPAAPESTTESAPQSTPQSAPQSAPEEIYDQYADAKLRAVGD